MKNVSVKQLCRLLVVGASCLLLGVLGVAILTKDAVQNVAAKQSQRYSSYLLADELRQSSDDLTRLARTYVITADARYEQQYNDILDIRNGRKPRPESYHRIYWDFVAATAQKPRPDGETAALQDLMKKAEFTDAEFDKLKQAQANSDALVRTEVIAMNAVKGRFNDGKGGFTLERAPDHEMARKLMHSVDYHKYKAEMMKPVDAFFVLLERRTSDAIAAAETKAGQLQMVLFVLIAATVLFIGAMTLLLNVRIVTPLLGLEGALQRLQQNQDLTLRVDERGGDELSKVAVAFNGFIASLQTTMQGVKTRTNHLLTIASSLSGAAGRIEKGSRAQNEAASSTAAAVEELAVSVAHVAENANAAAELATAAMDISTEGEKVVKDAASGISSIAQDVSTSASLAHSLSKRSDDISGIVRVIKDVAEQTNLLALNAAIEAARAGEQGRGFAVVADEVRKLAERTARSTAEITELINFVHTDTRDVVSNMEHSSSRVALGVDLSARAAQSLTAIRGSAHEAQIKVREIASATKEQSAASNDIAQHVERIARMTEENSVAARKASDLAGDLESLAGGLHTELSGFKTA